MFHKEYFMVNDLNSASKLDCAQVHPAVLPKPDISEYLDKNHRLIVYITNTFIFLILL